MTNGAERTRWKIRSDRLVDETPQVRLSIASLELASGLTFEQYVMRLPRCAMTVVLDEPAERILLIWRHRFIIDRWMWELPGGYIDPGEDGIAAAAREVEEETGYRPRSIEPILTFQPMTGSADSAHELYLARGADRVGAPLADEAEEVRWIPLADLPSLIATGQILGAATIIGAQHALLAAEGASRTVPSMAHESVTARHALGTTPGMRKGHSQTRERPLSLWPDLSPVCPGWIGTRRRRATTTTSPVCSAGVRTRSASELLPWRGRATHGGRTAARIQARSGGSGPHGRGGRWRPGPRRGARAGGARRQPG